MKKQRKQQLPRTPESWHMVNSPKGATFYTDKGDKDVTAIATYYGRKVTTIRRTVIDEPRTFRITEVTFVK
jgi:hypothetical protein